MAQKRLSMRKAKEILRLKYELRLSNRLFLRRNLYATHWSLWYCARVVRKAPLSIRVFKSFISSLARVRLV